MTSVIIALVCLGIMFGIASLVLHRKASAAEIAPLPIAPDTSAHTTHSLIVRD